jgi:hypothetical protein
MPKMLYKIARGWDHNTGKPLLAIMAKPAAEAS